MDSSHPIGSVTPSVSEIAALREHQRHLQALVMATLAGLIIMGGGVALFVAKQMRMVQQQLPENRIAIQKMTIDYQKASEPLIRNFSSAIAQFAATNRDFQPILEKYRPALSNYLGAPLPSAQPAGTNH